MSHRFLKSSSIFTFDEVEQQVQIKNCDDVVLTNPTNGDVLEYNNGIWSNTVSGGGGGGGEANDGVNLGSNGPFAQKNGLNFEFKDLIAGNGIDIVQNATSRTISSTISSGLTFKGIYNALINSPPLSSSGGGGVHGDYYLVSVGNQAINPTIDGIGELSPPDWIYHNSSIWQKMDHSDVVTSNFDMINVGNWNSLLNTPTLTSGLGVQNLYLVNTVFSDGVTILDGISRWEVGDVAWFDGGVFRRINGGNPTNTHAQIDAHIGDATLHRTINDAGTSATELWSSSKIATDLAAASGTAISAISGNVANIAGATKVAQFGGSFNGPGISSITFPFDVQILGYSASYIHNNTPISITNPHTLTTRLRTIGVNQARISSNCVTYAPSVIIWDSTDTGYPAKTWTDLTTPLNLVKGGSLVAQVVCSDNTPANYGATDFDITFTIFFRIASLAGFPAAPPINDLSDVNTSGVVDNNVLTLQSGTYQPAKSNITLNNWTTSDVIDATEHKYEINHGTDGNALTLQKSTDMLHHSLGYSAGVRLPVGNDSNRSTAAVNGVTRFTVEGGINRIETYNGLNMSWEPYTKNSDVSGDFVGTTDSQIITNKTITDNSNIVRASELGTSGASVVITGSSPPISGQYLQASGPTVASWVTPSGGAVSVLNDLTDVTTTTEAQHQIIAKNTANNAWVNKTLTGGRNSAIVSNDSTATFNVPPIGTNEFVLNDWKINEVDPNTVQISHTTSGSGLEIQKPGAPLSHIFSGTKGVQIPAGSDSERPFGVPGSIRYNNQHNYMEIFDNLQWYQVSRDRLNKLQQDSLYVSNAGATEWELRALSAGNLEFRNNSLSAFILPALKTDICGLNASSIYSSSFQLPIGDNAQRVGTAGCIRYNDEIETFEGFTTEWKDLASTGGGGGGPATCYIWQQTTVDMSSGTQHNIPMFSATTPSDVAYGDTSFISKINSNRVNITVNGTYAIEYDLKAFTSSATTDSLHYCEWVGLENWSGVPTKNRWSIQTVPGGFNNRHFEVMRIRSIVTVTAQPYSMELSWNTGGDSAPSIIFTLGSSMKIIKLN